MNKFDQLLQIKRESVHLLRGDDARVAVCPEVGGRVFAELAGLSLHRLDLDTVASPNRPFNNFGGLNFWPAPEGGKFGFNYRGNEWYVQDAINSQPFELCRAEGEAALIEKQVVLTNRLGTRIEATMSREVRLGEPPEKLSRFALRSSVTYLTADRFQVTNQVSVEDALIASWTLEQFDTSDDTVSFCGVNQPAEAINFDFYEHPGERITYFPGGFTYKTDGRRRGQIGIRRDSSPHLIGFYDVTRNLLCLRMNRNVGGGLYFNIADNDQPNGPYSAADTYSIFNSDPDMQAFELETIGAAHIENGLLKGSDLVSTTVFALFDKTDDLLRFVDSVLKGEGIAVMR